MHLPGCWAARRAIPTCSHPAMTCFLPCFMPLNPCPSASVTWPYSPPPAVTSAACAEARLAVYLSACLVYSTPRERGYPHEIYPTSRSVTPICRSVIGSSTKRHAAWQRRQRRAGGTRSPQEAGGSCGWQATPSRWCERHHPSLRIAHRLSSAT